MKKLSKTYCYSLLCVVFLLLISGCGFHLRGMASLPRWLDNIAIVDEHDYRELDLYLKEKFETYGIHVHSDPTLAKYRLIIQELQYEDNVSSISSSSLARQYQLIYKATFTLISKSGKEVVPENQVSVMRLFTSNNDRILSTDMERNLIKHEMLREIVDKMFIVISKNQ